MITIHLLLLILAFICAVLATFNVPSRVNLVAASLAFYFASILIGAR